MIRVDDKSVRAEGTTLDVVLDLARAITAVHESVKSMYDDKFADEAIVLAGKAAEFSWGCPSDDEIDKMLPLHAKEFERIVAEYIKRKKINDK